MTLVDIRNACSSMLEFGSTAALGLVILLASSAHADSGFRLEAPIFGTSKAYDGDGIYVSGVKIRLWGIDALELGTKRGDAAFAALARFDGQSVRCVPPPWSQSYPKNHDRRVALCQLTQTGEDLAWLQVRSGWADDWPEFSRGFYQLH